MTAIQKMERAAKEFVPPPAFRFGKRYAWISDKVIKFAIKAGFEQLFHVGDVTLARFTSIQYRSFEILLSQGKHCRLEDITAPNGQKFMILKKMK
jgi:hypothetical protein